MSAVEEENPEFSRLSGADLQALRLGAEVMAHKALLENRPRVADYFQSLEVALRERMEPTAEAVSPGPVRPTDSEDRQSVSQYLALLEDNERLSPAVREVCRQLRSRDGR